MIWPTIRDMVQWDRHPVVTEIQEKMKAAGAPEEAITSFTGYQNIPWMWYLTERQREYAAVEELSWRGFYVGSGMQFCLPTKPHLSSITTYGYNSKDWDNKIPRYCAERRALDQAKNFFADTYLAGIMIIGPLREEDLGLTLPSCSACTQVIQQSRFIRPWTGIVQIMADQLMQWDATIEVRTWSEVTG